MPGRSAPCRHALPRGAIPHGCAGRAEPLGSAARAGRSFRPRSLRCEHAAAPRPGAASAPLGAPWERRDRLRDAAQPARGSAVPVPAARRAAEQPGGTEVRAGQKRGELGAAGRAGREHRFCGRRAAGAACLEGQMGIATAE